MQFKADNILISKTYKELKAVIGFNSRGTQYSFSQWLSQDCRKYWEERGNQQLLHFKYLLERISYIYILKFNIYPLEKEIERRRIGSIQTMQEEKKKNEEAKPNSQRTEECHQQLTTSKLRALIKIIQAENQLTMLYYQAYQEQNNLEPNAENDFDIKPIMKDLKKGPNKFHAKYKSVIDQGVKREFVNKEIVLLNQISEISQLELIELRKKIYEKQFTHYVEEFESLGGFKKQNIIKKEDLEKISFDDKMLQEAEQILEEEKDSMMREVLKIGLELAVDAAYQLERTKEMMDNLKPEHKPAEPGTQ